MALAKEAFARVCGASANNVWFYSSSDDISVANYLNAMYLEMNPGDIIFQTHPTGASGPRVYSVATVNKSTGVVALAATKLVGA